jgi:hypothetical protein
MEASSRKSLFIIIIILMKRIFEELHCCLYVFRNSESCEIAVHKLWTRAGRRGARVRRRRALHCQTPGRKLLTVASAQPDVGGGVS